MKILIAGDFCPQQRVAKLFEHKDFATVLGDVKPIIEEADYSIVNFECAVTYGGEKPIEKIGPNLQCTKNGIEAIEWAGFNCVTLANNHFYDFGDEGVVNTLNACQEYGIDTVGGGIDLHEASKVLYKEINGQTLAVINCCEHEFSIATESSGGANPLNPIQQYYAIKDAKLHADYVLVIVHGGHEHYQLPSVRMQETYRFFVDAGADAVVNHHQHCFSGYEIYKEKPVFYGLGNFCFDKLTRRNGLWTEGYVISIVFSEFKISFTLYPYVQCAVDPIVRLLPQSACINVIEDLNAIIANTKRLQSFADKYYASYAEYYSDPFEPIRNRLYFAAKHRGWLPSLIGKSQKLTIANTIVCDAHRDKFSWWLRNS